MRPEVATRPAGPEAGTPAPAGPEAGAPSPSRPSGRGLVVEGLVVYVVFQLLTVVFLPALRSANESFYDDVLLGFFGPRSTGWPSCSATGSYPFGWTTSTAGSRCWPTSNTRCCTRATCRSGSAHLDRPGGRRRGACRGGWGLHVGLLPPGAAHRLGRGGAGRARLWFGAITLQHIILLNQLQVIAWMPLVVLFGHLALERGRWRWVVLCGVAAGLQLLAGHPEEWVYTLFALASYGLAWSLAGGWGPGRGGPFRRRGGWVGPWWRWGCCSPGSWARRWCCSARVADRARF